MGVWIKQIDRLIERGELVEVHRDSLGGPPLVGRLLRRTDELLLLHRVDEADGAHDGFVAVVVDFVTRISWESRDLRALRTLVDRAPLPPAPDVDARSLVGVIRSFQARFGYLAVHAENDVPDAAFVGELLEIDDDALHLRSYGARSAMDRGELLLALDAVTRVEADGRYERALMKLYEPPRLRPIGARPPEGDAPDEE